MQFAVILIWPGMFESRQHGVVMNGTDSGIDSSRVYSVGCSGVRVSGKVHELHQPMLKPPRRARLNLICVLLSRQVETHTPSRLATVM